MQDFSVPGKTLLELLVDGIHSLTTQVGREKKSEFEPTSSDCTSFSTRYGYGQKVDRQLQ